MNQSLLIHVLLTHHRAGNIRMQNYHLIAFIVFTEYVGGLNLKILNKLNFLEIQFEHHRYYNNGNSIVIKTQMMA